MSPVSTSKPQLAALRHRLTSYRGIIDSHKTSLATGSPLQRADSELLIRFFEDAAETLQKEIELYELTNGGIEGRKKACAHPERFISNAPPPPLAIGRENWSRPRGSQLSREESIEKKRKQLQDELHKAEARGVELERVIGDWYSRVWPEWNKVIAEPLARMGKAQEQVLDSGVSTSTYAATNATQAMPTPQTTNPSAKPESTTERDTRIRAIFMGMRDEAKLKGKRLTFDKGGEKISATGKFPEISAARITRILKERPK